MLESLELVLEMLDEYRDPGRAGFFLTWNGNVQKRADPSTPRQTLDVPLVTMELIDFPNERRAVCLCDK